MKYPYCSWEIHWCTLFLWLMIQSVKQWACTHTVKVQIKCIFTFIKILSIENIPDVSMISQSQSRSLSDILLKKKKRIQDQHMIWVFLNIFNRIHVNTPIESCKWSNDSQPAKPHCQKDSLTMPGPEKAHPVPLLTTLCQSKTYLLWFHKILLHIQIAFAHMYKKKRGCRETKPWVILSCVWSWVLLCEPF